MFYIWFGIIFLYIGLIKIFSNFNTRFLEIIIILIMVFIAALRSTTVGADTYNYVYFFLNSPNIFNLDLSYRPELEYGFKIYLAILRTFTDSQFLFLIISTLICLMPLYIGLRRMSPNYAFFGLVLYFFVFYLNYPINVLRQGMAMGIFIYSIPFILERKSVQVFILALLAGSIHSTGYLILLVYLYSIVESKKLIYLSLIFFILSIILYKYNLLQNVLFTYIAEEKEAGYTEKFNESTSLIQYIYRTIITIFFIMVAYCKKNENFIKILLVYLLGFFLYIALSDNNLLAARFNMFFRVLEVLMIAMTFSFCENLMLRFLIFSLFVLIYIPFFTISALLPINDYVLAGLL